MVKPAKPKPENEGNIKEIQIDNDAIPFVEIRDGKVFAEKSAIDHFAKTIKSDAKYPEFADLSNILEYLIQEFPLVTERQLEESKLPEKPTKSQLLKTIQAIIQGIRHYTHQDRRELFMEIFRSEELHDILTPDDCLEVFSSILVGSSDITLTLIEEVMGNYSVDWDEVIPDIPAFIQKLEALHKKSKSKSDGKKEKKSDAEKLDDISFKLNTLCKMLDILEAKKIKVSKTLNTEFNQLNAKYPVPEDTKDVQISDKEYKETLEAIQQISAKLEQVFKLNNLQLPKNSADRSNSSWSEDRFGRDDEEEEEEEVEVKPKADGKSQESIDDMIKEIKALRIGDTFSFRADRTIDKIEKNKFLFNDQGLYYREFDLVNLIHYVKGEPFTAIYEYEEEDIRMMNTLGLALRQYAQVLSSQVSPSKLAISKKQLDFFLKIEDKTDNFVEFLDKAKAGNLNLLMEICKYTLKNPGEVAEEDEEEDDSFDSWEEQLQSAMDRIEEELETPKKATDGNQSFLDVFKADRSNINVIRLLELYKMKTLIRKYKSDYQFIEIYQNEYNQGEKGKYSKDDVPYLLVITPIGKGMAHLYYIREKSPNFDLITEQGFTEVKISPKSK